MDKFNLIIKLKDYLNPYKDKALPVHVDCKLCELAGINQDDRQDVCYFEIEDNKIKFISFSVYNYGGAA